MHRTKTIFLREQHEEMLRKGKTILSGAATKKLFPKMRVLTTPDFFLIGGDGRDRYLPLTFCFGCQNPLPVDEAGNCISPIIFMPDDNISEIFGINFGGISLDAMIGELRTDILNQTKVFVPAASRIQCLTMPDILVRVRCTSTYPGKEASLARVLGARLFESLTNNSGRGGVDYWILSFSQAQASPQQLWEFRIRHAEQAFPPPSHFREGLYTNSSN